MSKTFKLIIPKYFQKEIIKFIKLDQDKRDEFLKILKSKDPKLLFNNLVSDEDFSKEDQKIVKFFTDIYFIYYDQFLSQKKPKSEFLDQLKSALIDIDEEFTIISEKWEVISKFFEQILDMYIPLGISARSTHILTSHEKVYHHSRLFTDFRPIYNIEIDDKKDTVEYGVIFHKLKINYSENFDEKEIYLALDYNDLMELNQIIQRAIKKEEILKRTLKDNIKIIGVNDDED